MTISFQCPHCNQAYTITTANAGKQVKCKQCAQMIQLPEAPQTTATDAISLESGAGETASGVVLPEAVVEELKKRLTYSRQASCEELLSDLGALRLLDAHSERMIKKGQKIASLSLIGMIVGGAGVFWSGSGGLQVLAAAFVLAGIGGFIYGVIFQKSHGRLNLEDLRYEIPAQLLNFLQVDTKPDVPTSCQIDFEQHNAQRKLIREGKAGRWNVKYFTSRWFSLQGRLADDTKYSLSMMIKHQDRHRTQRSASGKLKHKSKSKTAQEIALKFKLKEKRYPQLKEIVTDVARTAHQAVQIPSHSAIKSLEVSSESLQLTVTTPRSFQGPGVPEQKAVEEAVTIVTSMMLSLYQILNLAKAIEKA